MNWFRLDYIFPFFLFFMQKNPGLGLRVYDFLSLS